MEGGREGGREGGNVNGSCPSHRHEGRPPSLPLAHLPPFLTFSAGSRSRSFFSSLVCDKDTAVTKNLMPVAAASLAFASRRVSSASSEERSSQAA